MKTDRWPEGVPRDYEELFAKYGALIANEIRRKNVVTGNFPDLYQTVCEKLIAAQVLAKFVERVHGSVDEELPDTMTALEACELLGITFPQWRSRAWSYHKVFLDDLGGKAPCADKGHGTIIRRGKSVSWVAWMPTPKEGGYGSPKAVYKTSDVLEVPALGYFRAKNGEGGFSTAAWPKRKVQPHHFQAYLVRAVRNHFSNACRTIMRRHKDRTGDNFTQFRGPDGAYDVNWADHLADPMAGADAMENTVELHDQLEHMVTEDERGEISALLANYSIVEAVKLSSLPDKKKQVILRMCEA